MAIKEMEIFIMIIIETFITYYACIFYLCFSLYSNNRKK